MLHAEEAPTLASMEAHHRIKTNLWRHKVDLGIFLNLLSSLPFKNNQLVRTQSRSRYCKSDLGRFSSWTFQAALHVL